MAVPHGTSDHTLLCRPSSEATATVNRIPSAYNPLHSFRLAKGGDRHYQQQYADMYFARLAQLKPAAEEIAASAWSEFHIAGETARKVDRVLDVRQGELCWVTGTCFMDMPLKPNVLEDLGKEHWIAAPPPRVKYSQADAQGPGLRQVMLEDESGRLRLTGGFLKGCLLVTGAIVSVVGTENADGDFEVLDLVVPDLPPQPERWARHPDAATKQKATGKIAIVSGLGISRDEGDFLTLDLLLEYLLGESASPADQQAAASISHLIIAGNSLAHACPIPTREDITAAKKASSTAHAGNRKYGYDSSAYNSTPTDRLDTFLATLLPSLPITILPGEHDPTGVQLPQQPIHAAMFPHSRAYSEIPASATKPSWFDAQTNPAEFDLDGFRFLGTGGQTVDDVYKYISGEARLEMMEAMLRWRLAAPTAPDTLWCYPFQDGDQFVVKQCPHVFFAGSQPKFETVVIEGPVGQQVRLLALPRFRETGELVLLDVETLVPEVVKFDVFDEE